MKEDILRLVDSMEEEEDREALAAILAFIVSVY